MSGLDRLGLVKTSLIDFPGRVAAVIFTAGCNFHCPFCHNPELVGGTFPDTFLPQDEVLSIIKKRQNVLDGVVITGGEPLLHPDLGELIGQLRELGMQIKIDTNGSFPDRLSIAAPDYVAVDLKCAPGRYPLLTEIESPVEKLIKTIRWIFENEVEHELRTTVVPGLVDEEGFAEILAMARGTDRYVLNEFRSGKTLDPRLEEATPYPLTVYEKMQRKALEAGVPCTLRGRSFSGSASTP